MRLRSKRKVKSSATAPTGLWTFPRLGTSLLWPLILTCEPNPHQLSTVQALRHLRQMMNEDPGLCFSPKDRNFSTIDFSIRSTASRSAEVAPFQTDTPGKHGLARRINLVIHSRHEQGILQRRGVETDRGPGKPAILTSVPEPLPHGDDTSKSCIHMPSYQVHSKFKDTLLRCFFLNV